MKYLGSVTNAKDIATKEYVDNAVASDGSAITMVITSSMGTVFKNGSISTTLTAHVYKAGKEITASTSPTLASLGTIKWYKDGGSTAVHTGQDYTITGEDVTNKATYTAQLEGQSMAVKAIATITLHAVVDVSATYRYYKLQSATLAAPSRPMAKPADPLKQAPSGWSIAEPAYSTGSTDKLYTVDLTVFSDDTFQYSNVSLSSSYEAAKEAWNKASNAQSTADSAKSYIDTITAQYGYQYKYDLTVYGDRTDYYYPVYFIGGNQDIPREVLICRSYGEKAPSDWNTATHKGSLILRIKANYGNWGGVNYKCEILDFSQQYSMTVGDVAINKLLGYAMCVWLRGGGTTGAVYHVFSDQKIEYNVFGGWHTGAPIIATEGGIQIGWTGGTESNPAYRWVSDYPLTAPNTSSLDRLQAIKMANAAIKYVDVEYYLSTSATALSGGSWSTTAPAWVDGKYMWSRTVTTDGAGNKTYSPSQNGVCIAGAKGSTGIQGEKGDTGSDGKGVVSIAEQYYKSTSATSLSDGSWSDTYPGWENDKYIWTRSVITYTDNTTTTTTAVCVTGNKGDTGSRGIDVKSVTRYYYLSATAPTAPSTSWATTEPTYDATADADKSLYYADYTVYSSGSGAWSAISKSSSYEAAKQAYNKADATSQKLASWCAENNQTLIDGSKIYAGSVGAKQINVTDLFAQDITASGTITGSTLKGSSAELTSGKIGPFALDPSGLTSTLSTNMVFNSRDVGWASYVLKRFEENDSIVVFARSLSMSYIDSCSFTADVDSLTSDIPDYRAIDVDGNIVSNITALRLVPVFLAGGDIYYADGFSNLDINNAKTSAKSSGAATFGLGLQVRVAGTTSSGTVTNPTIKIKWAAQSQQAYRNGAFTDDLLSAFNPKATITVSSVDIAMTVDGFKYGVFEVNGGYANVRGGSLRVSNQIEATNTRMSNSDSEYLDSSAKGIFAYKYVNGSSGFSCPALYTYPAYTQSDNTNRICSYNWLDDPTDYDDPYTECDYTKLPLDIEASALKLNGTNVSVAGHTHDDRYYTETEINNLLEADTLKEKLGLNPVSVSLTRSSSNTPSSSTYTCTYIPALSRCFFRGYLAARSSTTFASGTSYTLWTVAEGYRPSTRHALAITNASNTRVDAWIKDDGTIQVTPRGATINASNLFYITGWWGV